MMGVPPICQSADGNGGESNGAGGMRRGGGVASGAGVSYAGEFKSFANASNKRWPNQSAQCAMAAFEITIAVTIPTFVRFNISPDSNKAHSRDESPHFAEPFHDSLHFNDADEVSCRAGATKYSRCRASFAPISSTFAKENLVPPLDRQLADPLSETKNCRNVRIAKKLRQIGQSRTRHYIDGSATSKNQAPSKSRPSPVPRT